MRELKTDIKISGILYLALGLIRLEIFNAFNVCLNSRRWFMLCLVCVPYLVLVQVPGDRD
jgi:hypothetical protein